MTRVLKKVIYIGLFHYTATVHNNNLIAHLSHNTQIMGDKNDRCTDVLFQLIHQIKNLCLNRNIQRRSGFIRNQNLGIAYESHGNHNSLALTARQLKRIFIHNSLHTGKTGFLQNIDCKLLCLLFGNILMKGDILHNLSADLHNRIQAGHGFLEHHGNILTSHLSSLLIGHLQNILPVQKNLSFHNFAGGTCEKSHQRKSRYALSAAGFAYNTQSFSSFQFNIHTIYRFYRAIICKKVGMHIFDFQYIISHIIPLLIR